MTSSTTSKTISTSENNAPDVTRVIIGSDHRGVAAKRIVADTLREMGIAVEDVGAYDEQSVDYPDFAEIVARAVAADRTTRGVLVCGSGIGMSIAANKVAGIRAALVHEVEAARMSRLHNDANVLVLAGGRSEPRKTREIVEVWMRTGFEGGRHQRRVDKIAC